MNYSRARTAKLVSRGTVAYLVLALVSTSLTGCGFFPITGITPSKASKAVSGTYVPRGKDLSIWFVKEDNGNLDLVPVSRPKFSEDALTSAIDELLQGPDRKDLNAGIGTEIPRGTILLGLKRNGGSVELNLSKRFAAGGGPTSMETRLKQLARTVKDIEGDVDVFVNIEGERLTASNADGLEIAQPINREPAFN